MSESIINRDKKTLTYKESLIEKYRPLVLLVREMEKTIGKENALRREMATVIQKLQEIIIVKRRNVYGLHLFKIKT